MTAVNSANPGTLEPSALAAQLGPWSAGAGPLYRQLATGVERLIAEGVLRQGDRLPAERTLAAELSVSRGTLVAAYDLLRSRGAVERVRGSGTRVTAGAVGAVGAMVPEVVGSGAALFSAVPDTVDLLKAVPPMTGPALDDAVGFDLAAHADAWGSVEPAGIPALRAAIAERYTAAGLPTDLNEILVTSGAQQAISLVVHEVVARGDVVLTEHLTWPGLTDTVRRAGGRVHGVPMDAHGIDVDELRLAIERHRPVLVALNPHHHNPTGGRLSPERRRLVAEVAADHAVPVLEDRVAAALAFDGVVPAPLARHRPDAPGFTIDSLSKVAWIGLRIGWVRTDVVTLHALRSSKTLADLWSSIPSQLIALSLLDRLDASVRDQVATLGVRARVLADELARRLPEWDVAAVRGGMVLWARLPSGSARSFARFATRYGVAVASSREFSTSTPVDDHVRIPFTQPEHVLVESVDRLAAAWAAFPNRTLDEPTDHPAIV